VLRFLARVAASAAAVSLAVVTPAAAAETAAGVAARPDGSYWLARSDGSVLPGGGAPDLGGGSPMALNRPVVGVATTPTGGGYWLVAGAGGIFTFGDAAFFGSTGDLRLNQPVVTMASTPTGRGYWLVAADGGIFTFGDAAFLGSTGDLHLNQPIVAMAPTPTGRGYWLVARDGGIFTFGDAAFFGSTGAVRLNQPIIGISTSRSGQGYRLVASDGGVFTFGDADFLGSAATSAPADPFVGIAAAPGNEGYLLVRRSGAVASFGKVAPVPSQAVWFGGWNTDVRADAQAAVARADAAGARAVLVAYNLPGRDCGGPGVGATDASAYHDWIAALADGIGNRRAMVVVEPDALAELDCFDQAGRERTLATLRGAISTVSFRAPNAAVYLDAGHSRWQPVATMAARLQAVGIGAVRGFSLNVSNFGWTADEVAYGDAIVQALGNNAHYVVDTSRNGAGPPPDGQWCNPHGWAAGAPPAASTDAASALDALLWVKPAGESDGTC
jgi:hypothetical protein